MRIVGGRHRGTRLASVRAGDVAAHLRPTSDRVRETIFNLLQNGCYGDPVEGARVLDLFAGTGALGLEALSRGAEFVLFVDNGVKAGGIIRENIDTLRAIGLTNIFRRDATRLGPALCAPFDLVFLDPPYGKALGRPALSRAREYGWLADDVLIVWEEGAQQAVPEGFGIFDARRYGETWVHILHTL
ncbi:MAG: 16S rRNA (guanine(966)-N(2))-methyltransferase RsmD [Rhodobacteraceae bacterium]|nr:16S rRNA (guanine(966)-N(2))-methyltransferase RsmD [Paracoccaceae bacterium]